MIRFEAVTKVYGGRSPAPDASGSSSPTSTPSSPPTGPVGAGSVAVDRLTLTAPTGATTVLVGPSGCGKTTTLRMVNRMIEPTSGRILIGDDDAPADTADMNPVQLRRGIGYVIQAGGLFPHHTVERNIMTVPLLLGWDQRRARARAAELLETVGLDATLARRYPAQLSGGQQQRVGVARALAADPPVLLLDEPFSAVDPVVREQLQDELLALQARLHKTLLLVTHDIDEAIKLGDQVAVLRAGGHLAQVADPAYLLAHPADDFVADFLGKDRGYRSLGFQSGPAVRVRREETVELGADARALAGSPEGWVLVVADGAPVGWVEPARVAGPIRTGDLALGGTLARAGGALRGYLDAALSSPSRRGVVVDAAGQLVGTVSAQDVLVAIEATTPPSAAPADSPSLDSPSLDSPSLDSPGADDAGADDPGAGDAGAIR